MANKKELAQALAEKHDLPAAKVQELVTDTFELVAHQLMQGEEVQLAGFGKFSVASRPARQGRNPATGQPIQIDASRSVKFKASSTLKEELNK